MKRPNLRLTWVLALLALITGVALAATPEFVLRYERQTGFRDYLRQNGFVVLRSIPGQPVHLVRRAPRAVERSFEPADGVYLEPNVEVWIPEAKNETSLVDTLQFLLQALNDPVPVDYYGSVAIRGFADQPAATQTRADVARGLFGLGVWTVAVVDTGSDPNHPFLAPVLVPGYDFVRERPGFAPEQDELSADQRSRLAPPNVPFGEMELYQINPTTTPLLERSLQEYVLNNPLPKAFGHGTMVMGSIRLVAPGARLMPLKAFDGTGRGTLFNVLRALYFAQANGARVINMSLSSTVRSEELERAVAFLDSQRVMLVASAGNDGVETAGVYPAGFDRVLGVASVSPLDARSRFTNFGVPLVTLSAPGEGLLLPYPGNRWAGGWGTSFAAPLVSGVAALVLGRKSDATTNDLESAVSHAAALSDPRLGAGRLDVVLALGSL